MKRIFYNVLLTMVFVGIFFAAYSQGQTEPTAKEREQARQVEADLEKRRAAMRNLVVKQETRITPREIEEANARRRDAEEGERCVKELLKIEPADIEKYKDFLKGDKTGILRLF